MARAHSRKPGEARKNRKRINTFCVSLAREASFKKGGLRSFFAYRDLGIKAATGGRVGAHVIRAMRPCGEGTGRHRHRLDFQLVYVLKGRAKFWYEGQGEITLGPGDCVHQPPGIAHELTEGSADLEMLEITLPAQFATNDVPAAPVAKPKRRLARPTGAPRQGGGTERPSAAAPRRPRRLPGRGRVPMQERLP